MLAALLSAVILATTWQQPPPGILEVLHAPQTPWPWTSPDGSHMLLLRSVYYPPLADRAAAMAPLAGIRVDTRTNAIHGREGYEDPVLVEIATGKQTPLDLGGARVLRVAWSPDGKRVAMTLKEDDHVGLWVGTADGRGRVVPDLAINPLIGPEMTWMPDRERLVVLAIPKDRGEAPAPPPIPGGPDTREGDGNTAISTYEARDLLQTAHDDALFTYYGTSQIGILDAKSLRFRPLGEPAMYWDAAPSPDGKHLLVERAEGPWSHRHAYWRFAHDVEVWSLTDGKREHTVAELPLADSVPIHGTTTGPRSVHWRASAPATLVWMEAQDNGDWSVEVPHRDYVMMHEAPFGGEPDVVFRAEHRMRSWWWGEHGGDLVVEQYERAERWRHVWMVDVDERNGAPWFDLSYNDRYADPGRPVTHPLPSGHRVFLEDDGALFFSGRGSSETGDRPFLDRRPLGSDRAERLFRCDPERYERFIAFTDVAKGEFLLYGESPTEPPNVSLASIGEGVEAPEGEAVRAFTSEPVTRFEDPTPVLRDIERRIVTYEREDGTPLSFTLYLPPGYEEGTRLPTVVYAYPLEFSDAKTAGQVRGSEKTFTRFAGPSHLFFLLQGYAVLNDTRMPVIGDPDTAYDTFVEQLVSGAKAAVEKAVALGVTDPERIGVMGHSHGGLMTVTLLAHSDLFRAGIARSGAYNHTIRPFGFQSERRTLWEAKDTYLQLSPVMFAPQIDEPLLLIHGAIDENPGTIPFQSERLFEAVRGVGGTVRWVSLPFEGHGYRARESVEHVLWEQLEWFGRYVKGEG
ncbi:prolyl oligopeptidase family serine peptidase [bacterium]|nr:prolyl oligopeptidase family serine peptidase [bacterium]